MPTDHGLVAETLTVHLGAAYRYCCGHLYAPLALADMARTGQHVVVYEGLSGPDRGRLLVATLSDWQTRFVLVEQTGVRP